MAVCLLIFGELRMPKPGYTTIVVKKSVRSQLQELAEAQGYRSINQLFEAWLGVYPTGINEKIRHPKISLKWLFSKKAIQNLVRPPGFEPGIASLEGLRPNQARRRPQIEM